MSKMRRKTDSPKRQDFFLGGEQLFLRGSLHRHFQYCLWIYSNSHRIQINCIANPTYLSLILSMFGPPLSLPNVLQQAFYSRSWEPCTDHMLMTQLGQDHGNIYFISTPALWKECRPQTTVQVALTQSACQRAGVSLRRRELPSVCGGLHLIPNTAKLNKKMNEQVQLGQWCKRILSKKRVKKLPWEELTSLQESELCHVRDVFSAFLWLLPVGKTTPLLLTLQMRGQRI